MLLSPEALLRGPVSYELSLVYNGRVRACVSSYKPMKIGGVYYWYNWDSQLDRFLACLRAVRFCLVPSELNRIETSDRLGTTPPLTRAILHLAHTGGFLSNEIPALEAVVNETTLENCIVVSFELGGPVTGQKPVDWYLPEKTPVKDWVDCRKCLCVAFMVPPGTLDLAQWTENSSLELPQLALFIPEIMRACVYLATAYAALTDGSSTVLFDIKRRHSSYSPVTRITDEPSQLCIAHLIYSEARASHLWIMPSIPQFSPYLGALNDPSIALPPIETILASRHILSDFDVYAMQRDKRLWEQFLVWKAVKRQEAETNPLLVGDTLVAETQSFIHRFMLLRSPLPMPQIPPDTVARIGGSLRSRDATVDSATSNLSDSFIFKITKIIRTTKDTFSQVFSGVVRSQDGVYSREVCLKLYDERFFGTPFYGDSQDIEWLDLSIHPGLPNYDDEVVQRRLLNWNVAEDIARREEAAYDRLKEFQGSLIPHSYGFHHFTLPNGHRCVGFLMEYIDGVSLGKAQIGDLPVDSQSEFARTVRHGLRVLRYAQIEQTDWHADQFIVQNSASDCVVPKVVFIDFGFAVQHLDALFTPPTRDWFYCRNRLWEVMDKSIVASEWFPLDEHEY